MCECCVVGQGGEWVAGTRNRWAAGPHTGQEPSLLRSISVAPVSFRLKVVVQISSKIR